MIDIKKLEKLSCLTIDTKVEIQLSESLSNVIDMMQDISSISIDNIVQPPCSHNFIEKTTNHLYSKDEKIEGIHLEQGMFLAPKVIKK